MSRTLDTLLAKSAGSVLGRLLVSGKLPPAATVTKTLSDGLAATGRGLAAVKSRVVDAGKATANAAGQVADTVVRGGEAASKAVDNAMAAGAKAVRNNDAGNAYNWTFVPPAQQIPTTRPVARTLDVAKNNLWQPRIPLLDRQTPSSVVGDVTGLFSRRENRLFDRTRHAAAVAARRLPSVMAAGGGLATGKKIWDTLDKDIPTAMRAAAADPAWAAAAENRPQGLSKTRWTQDQWNTFHAANDLRNHVRANKGTMLSLGTDAAMDVLRDKDYQWPIPESLRNTGIPGAAHYVYRNTVNGIIGEPANDPASRIMRRVAGEAMNNERRKYQGVTERSSVLPVMTGLQRLTGMGNISAYGMSGVGLKDEPALDDAKFQARLKDIVKQETSQAAMRAATSGDINKLKEEMQPDPYLVKQIESLVDQPAAMTLAQIYAKNKAISAAKKHGPEIAAPIVSGQAMKLFGEHAPPFLQKYGPALLLALKRK